MYWRSRLFESCSDLLLSIVLTQYVKYSRLDRLVVWSPPSLSSKPEAVSRAGPKYSKWTRPLTSRYRLLRSHQTVYVTFHTVKQRNKRLQCSCKIDNSNDIQICTFCGLFKRAFSEWIFRILTSRYRLLRSHQTRRVFVNFYTLNNATKNCLKIQCSNKIDHINDIQIRFMACLRELFQNGFSGFRTRGRGVCKS